MAMRTTEVIDEEERFQEDAKNDSRTLLMGLLLPLLFLGGWLANDIFTPDTPDQQRFGVGAGPGDVPLVSPTTLPLFQPTWSTGVSPNVSPATDSTFVPMGSTGASMRVQPENSRDTQTTNEEE